MTPVTSDMTDILPFDGTPMDSDGYTTPANDGMYTPSTHHNPAAHHGYGSDTTGTGYGPAPTPTASVAVPAPPTSLPVTSAPGGGHVGLIVAVGVIAAVAGIGLLRVRRAPRLADGHRGAHRPG